MYENVFFFNFCETRSSYLINSGYQRLRQHYYTQFLSWPIFHYAQSAIVMKTDVVILVIGWFYLDESEKQNSRHPEKEQRSHLEPPGETNRFTFFTVFWKKILKNFLNTSIFLY